MSTTPWDQPTEVFQGQPAPAPLSQTIPAGPMPGGEYAEPAGVADDEFEDDPEHLATARSIPAWAVSLTVHVGVLLLFAGITLPKDLIPGMMINSEMEDIDPDTYKFDTTVVDQIGTDSQVNRLSPSQAAATRKGADQQKQMERKLEEMLAPQLPDIEEVIEPNEAEILESVPRTGTTEHPGGVEGSVDRMTMELAGSLQERKTMVAWVFDRSPSVQKRREEIAQRFENIYAQLGMLKVDKNKALKTGVVAFGEQTTFLTENAVDDVKEVVEKMRAIKPDPAGVENVFQAVLMVANKWLIYRKGGDRRNFLIVVVTDEAGSDQHLLDQVITLTKRHGIKVYVIGNAAPFGRKTIEIPWELPDGQMTTAVLEPGPETILPERLHLPFWSVKETDLKEMSSGYGPYALTRLCAETGGMYLITQDTNGPRFDPSVMRDYHPSYDPIKVYEKDIMSNKAKLAIIEAARLLKVKNVPKPKVDFDAPNDNVLRTQLTDAQKPAAVIDYGLVKLVTLLEKGEKDRAKIKDARWRANYDLGMGRAIAMRVRADGYNRVLANMKASPKSFANKDSNHWTMVPAREISAGPAVRKLAKKATEYLTRVMDEHPGTPWAVLAEKELSQPMGWAWKESRRANASTGQRPAGAAKNDPRLLLADEKKKKEAAKKKPKPAPPRKINI